jgi:tRNA(Arg) A34 adenosine deaminase TadA
VKNFAFLSIPKVVKGFKEMFSCIFMGQNFSCELKKILCHCEMELLKQLLKYERN